ncbi:hypothetical protein Y032_0065g3588 [Ancylostoma ceylanicum]|uniref:ribonuclease H n=1 Tax=Ancylostoma ceylanicum TaxID=53326 RepID=A0A016TZN3_9BILA|nr:hypothetical protein Y032_0065g3588 [Ancylostoma ceylanicum]
MAKGGFYAVANGRNVGVYTTWDQCRAEVNGFPQARYKKFGTEREAQEFIANYQLGRRAASSSGPPTGASDSAQSSIVSRKRKGAVAISGADYVAPKRLKDWYVWLLTLEQSKTGDFISFAAIKQYGKMLLLFILMVPVVAMDAKPLRC